MFGVVLAVSLVQRMFPRKVTVVHKDQNGFQVDPSTGRRI